MGGILQGREDEQGGVPSLGRDLAMVQFAHDARPPRRAIDAETTGAPSPDWRFGSGLRIPSAEMDEEHQRAKVFLAHQMLPQNQWFFIPWYLFQFLAAPTFGQQPSSSDYSC